MTGLYFFVLSNIVSEKKGKPSRCINHHIQCKEARKCTETEAVSIQGMWFESYEDR